MIRAHLIMNPQARRVTPAVQRVVKAALEAKFKLDVTDTYARNAGVEVARQAAEGGSEVLIAFGGDGLVNEVINGMAGSDASLAIIPGGTMNVFARNLGLPADPLEATDRLMGVAGEVEPRSIVLASAAGRLFAFACGCGFDAEAAAKVESRTTLKKRFGEPYFYSTAAATFAKNYLNRKPFLEISGEFGSLRGVMATAVNFGPYAYLAGRPVHLAPASGKDLGLFVLERLRLWRVPSYISGVLGAGGYGKDATRIASVSQFKVSSESPFAIHVDGESIDARSEIEVTSRAGEVRVI